MLILKPYQERCLGELGTYLALAGQVGAKAAFERQTQRTYRAVPHLPELPYVCIRVPTGGGKTFMACHALAIAARQLLQQDRAACLWLVPSNAIKEQTLKALRDRAHPYRQALDAAFGGNVAVMDLAEALYVQRATLEGNTTVIVATMAAQRVQDIEDRKVYEAAGALSHHFSALPGAALVGLEKYDNGEVIPSLANVLRLWKPVVIMDEAHRARTKLSFETLERFAPSCIVEFTATPETQHDPEHGLYASNVLTTVSARTLKDADMIKLPILLHTRGHWREVLADAVERQKALEAVAEKELREKGEYIRPIVLIQSEKHRQDRDTVTAEVVKRELVTSLKVPEDRIAVVTRETRELDGVDLFSANVPLRFVITQQALKEGWDCSFAYIFCTVADIGTARDVEQFLGRVLRLPKATRKGHEELNRAYAMVSSPRTADTMAALNGAMVVIAEALEENGFDRREANDFVSPVQAALPGVGPLFASGGSAVSFAVPDKPDLSKIEGALAGRVTYDEAAGTVVVAGPLTAGQCAELSSCFGTAEGKKAVESFYAASQGEACAPEPLRIPKLCVWVDGQLEMFEESHFLDANWDLSKCDGTLTDSEFPSEVVDGADGEVDIALSGKIETRFVGQVRKQLMLLRPELGWTLAKLVNQIDRDIAHEDVTREQSTLFIHRAIEKLMQGRGVTVEQLAAERVRLTAALAKAIGRHRASMRLAGYQRLLTGRSEVKFGTSPAVFFLIGADQYAPGWYYDGSYTFRKNALPVGELRGEGEEFQCAQYIDQLPAVKRWVRNLAGPGREQCAVWLQTSSDRFYPDFVAELTDGRFLIVEYKNADDWSKDDSKEKRTLGELWADRSDGRCVFVMPKGIGDLGAIDKAIGS